MKTNNDQQGFSTLEVILLLLLILVVGGAAFFVHSRNTVATTQPAATSSTSAKKTTDSSASSSSAASATNVVTETTFSKLPASFKTAFVSHAKSGDSNCVGTNGLPVDDSGAEADETVSYISGKFVSLSECNARAIYAYENGAWVFVEKTAFEYDCDTLKLHKVPAVLVSGDGSQDAKCLNSSDADEPYTQA